MSALFEYKVESYIEDAGWSQPNEKGEVKWEKRSPVGIVAERKMNERGAEGWELVNVIFDGKSLTAFYKRLVTPPTLTVTVPPGLEWIKKLREEIGLSGDWRQPIEVVSDVATTKIAESDKPFPLVASSTIGGPKRLCICHNHPSPLPCGAPDCINIDPARLEETKAP